MLKNNPVTYNRYGNWRDVNNRVGMRIEQYPTLDDFVSDIWIRYRPWGGKCFFENVLIFQVEKTDQLICKDETSKFFNEIVENYYLTRDMYKDLKQHYKCNEYLF